MSKVYCKHILFVLVFGLDVKVYCKHILFVLVFGLDVQSVLQAYTVCVGIRVRCPKCTVSIYCLCWYSG